MQSLPTAVPAWRFGDHPVRRPYASDTRIRQPCADGPLPKRRVDLALALEPPARVVVPALRHWSAWVPRLLALCLDYAMAVAVESHGLRHVQLLLHGAMCGIYTGTARDRPVWCVRRWSGGPIKLVGPRQLPLRVCAGDHEGGGAADEREEDGRRHRERPLGWQAGGKGKATPRGRAAAPGREGNAHSSLRRPERVPGPLGPLTSTGLQITASLYIHKHVYI